MLLRSLTLSLFCAIGAGCPEAEAPAATTPSAPVATTPVTADDPSPAPVARAEPPAKPAPTPPAAADAAPAVTAGGWTITPPEGWVAERPSSGMRLGQYRLPRAEGDTRDGEVTIIVAGGDVASNIARWRAQFEGEPEAETRTVEAAGAQLTRVSIAGTYLYKERPMAPGPGERIEGAIVEALILPGDSGRSVFIKGWGPKATMAHWSASWDTLTTTLTR